MMYLLCKYDVVLRTNDVLLEDAAGDRRTLPYPDKELTRLGIDEGGTVVLTADGTLKKA